MGIVDRFKALNLPADDCVVIGSGILDALGLRQTSDVDLIVSDELFETLRASGDWVESTYPSGDKLLSKGDVEVCVVWGKEPWLSFESIKRDSVVVDGVRFAHPETVLRWKKQKNRPKDEADIKSLTEYLNSGSI